MSNYTPGSGAIWGQKVSDEIPTQYASTAPGLVLAKAALAAGGALQMPDVGVALGAGWANIGLWFFDATGKVYISRFHMADGTDPTKRMAWDATAITTATIHTATLPNYGGFVLLPATLGNSGEFLKSLGAGIQPIWASIPPTQNALLDGVNHTDTLAQAVLRGALVVGNSTPNWARLPIGAASTLLKSDGTDPSWGTLALLSAFHSDTLAGTPVRGDLMISNSTPAWTKLGIGAVDTVLYSNGTDPSWASAGSIAALLQHDLLRHLKPLQVTNCSWTTGTTTITHASGGLANVKVGDLVYLGDNTGTQNQGRRVTVWNNSNSVTVDATNGNGTLTNVTIIFFPGDHWDDTMVMDSATTGGGLFCTGGRGTYNAVNTAGTFQEIQGPLRWRALASGAADTDFRVQGSKSTSTRTGFAIERFGTAGIMYFYVGQLTASRVLTIPNWDGKLVTEGTAQNITDKTLQTNNSIEMDGTLAGGTVFSLPSAGGNRLGFSFTGMTALRVATWQDRAGTVAYLDDLLTSGVYAPGSTTLANGAYRVHVKQLRLTTIQRLTMAGDSRLVLMN